MRELVCIGNMKRNTQKKLTANVCLTLSWQHTKANDMQNDMQYYLRKMQILYIYIPEWIAKWYAKHWQN